MNKKEKRRKKKKKTLSFFFTSAVLAGIALVILHGIDVQLQA